MSRQYQGIEHKFHWSVIFSILKIHLIICPWDIFWATTTSYNYFNCIISPITRTVCSDFFSLANNVNMCIFDNTMRFLQCGSALRRWFVHVRNHGDSRRRRQCENTGSQMKTTDLPTFVIWTWNINKHSERPCSGKICIGCRYSNSYGMGKG